MRELVSVVIPVFNGESTIRHALDSVWHQTYRPLEVIVVDDGSTDSTVLLVQSDADVIYLRQNNSGPASARNHGIQRATGKYLAFLDADDLWLPAKIERQVAHLDTSVETGIVLCRMHCFLEANATWPAALNQAYYLSDPPAMIPSALLARRSVFEQVGDFDADYAGGDDSDWFFRARDAGIASYIVPEVLLHKRIAADSVSTNVPRVHQELLRQIRASVKRKIRGDAGTVADDRADSSEKDLRL